MFFRMRAYARSSFLLRSAIWCIELWLDLMMMRPVFFTFVFRFYKNIHNTSAVWFVLVCGTLGRNRLQLMQMYAYGAYVLRRTLRLYMGYSYAAMVFQLVDLASFSLIGILPLQVIRGLSCDHRHTIIILLIWTWVHSNHDINNNLRHIQRTTFSRTTYTSLPWQNLAYPTPRQRPTPPTSLAAQLVHTWYTSTCSLYRIYTSDIWILLHIYQKHLFLFWRSTNITDRSQGHADDLALSLRLR